MRTASRPPSPRRARLAPTLVAGLLLLGLVVPVTAGADTDPGPGSRATGATITSAAPAGAVVLRVEEGAPANELTNGTVERPYPTIGWAVAVGQWLRTLGHPVHVLVAPGTYRENIVVGAAGIHQPPLVIESAVPGGATVTGADVEDRWSAVDGNGHTTAPWHQNWGLAPIPAGWDGVHVPDGIRRREAVFIDGTPAVQVLTEDALVDNSFYVDEAGDRIVLDPPAGVTDMADHDVEVARRQHTLRIRGLARSVAVTGFVFEGTATPLEKSMAYITNSTDVLVEGNTFQHSGWGGLGVCCTAGITIRGNDIVDNGGSGMNSTRTSNAVIENNVVAGNNLRGARHGYTGWSVAGAKNLFLSDAVLRGNTYVGNLARGLWLDTSVTDVLIEGDRSCGNGGDGLFIEAVQGPVAIRDATFCDNHHAGIAIGTSSDITIEGSAVSDNRAGQLVFTGQRQRSWIDNLTGALLEVSDFADITLNDNALASSGTPRLIYSPNIPLADWTARLEAGEITASGNTWSRPDLDDAIVLQNQTFSLEDWAALTGDTQAIAEPEPEPEPDGNGNGNGNRKSDQAPGKNKGKR